MTDEQKTICHAQCYDSKGKTHRFGRFAASVSAVTVRETADPTIVDAIKEMFRGV